MSLTRKLEHHTLATLHEAASRLQLDRNALLSGLPARFVSTMRLYDNPAAQLLSDLHTLNETPRLADDQLHPLLVWLNNATTLSADRLEERLFRGIEREYLELLLTPVSSTHEIAPRDDDDDDASTWTSDVEALLRYYIYISPTKVRMLLAQLPGGARRRRTTLFEEASLITTHLRKLPGAIGTIHDRKPYLQGTMRMNWGILSSHGANAVFFGGQSSNTRVALLGSVLSLVGNWHMPATSPRSEDFYLFHFLSRENAAPQQALWTIPSDAESPSTQRQLMSDFAEALTAYERFTSGATHQSQSLEFVARSLAQFDTNHGRIVIGSPLYVAHHDGALE